MIGKQINFRLILETLLKYNIRLEGVFIPIGSTSLPSFRCNARLRKFAGAGWADFASLIVDRHYMLTLPDLYIDLVGGVQYKTSWHQILFICFTPNPITDCFKCLVSTLFIKSHYFTMRHPGT